MSSNENHLLHPDEVHSVDYSRSGEFDVGMTLEDANLLLGISPLNHQAATQVSGFPPSNFATPSSSYNDTVQFDNGMLDTCRQSPSDLSMGNPPHFSNVQSYEVKGNWVDNMFVGVPGINVIEDDTNPQDFDYSIDGTADQLLEPHLRDNHLQPYSATSSDPGASPATRSRSASPSSVRSGGTFSNPDKIKKKPGRPRNPPVDISKSEEALILLRKKDKQEPGDKAEISRLSKLTSQQRCRQKQLGRVTYFTDRSARYDEIITRVKNYCKPITVNADGSQTEFQKGLAELLEEAIDLRDEPEPVQFQTVTSYNTNSGDPTKLQQHQQKIWLELEQEKRKNKFTEQLIANLINRFPSSVDALNQIASDISGSKDSWLHKGFCDTVTSAKSDLGGTIARTLESQKNSSKG